MAISRVEPRIEPPLILEADFLCFFIPRKECFGRNIKNNLDFISSEIK
jgi:hypothetical protein